DARIARAVDSALKRSGLRIVSRGRLKTYPGSTHWHFRNGEQRGTLELTWWPAKRKLWFKVQAGRDAGWIDQAVRTLARSINRRTTVLPLGMPVNARTG